MLSCALVSIADLSFAVPATAASYVFETILAKYVLKERISGAALDRRLPGCLRGRAAFAVSYVWAVPAIAAAAYYLIALVAAVAPLAIARRRRGVAASGLDPEAGARPRSAIL